MQPKLNVNALKLSKLQSLKQNARLRKRVKQTKLTVKICNEALKGLLALGIDEAKGKEILQAINKGLVPHVSIKF